MLSTIDLIDEGRGVHLVAAHGISGEQLIAAHRHILREHPSEFARCDFWMLDYSATRGDALNSQQVREIAEITRTLSRINGHIAVGAWAERELLFGMARMWQNLSPDLEWPVLIDRELEVVCAWLEEQVGRPVDPRSWDQRIRWFELPDPSSALAAT